MACPGCPFQSAPCDAVDPRLVEKFTGNEECLVANASEICVEMNAEVIVGDLNGPYGLNSRVLIPEQVICQGVYRRRLGSLGDSNGYVFAVEVVQVAAFNVESRFMLEELGSLAEIRVIRKKSFYRR